jgi:amidase
MTDTTWLDATAQAGLVRRGELSPGELVAAAIARIEAVKPQLNAVLSLRASESPASSPTPRSST